MRWSSRTGVTVVVALGALLAGYAPAMAEPARLAEPGADPAAVQPQLLAELDQQGTTDFWVVLDERADLRRADQIEDWAARGRYVHDQLVETARASQADLAAELTARGVDFEPYWIANQVLVRGGDRSTLAAVRTQAGVAEVRADEPVALPAPITGQDSPGTTAVEWGIANIRADRVWSELGVRGEGVVVGSIDTGVQFTHPALVDTYRGTLAGGGFDHDYNWWDPSEVCPTDEPCDNNNHGTHTMGTMVGDGGAGNQIGVAPGARWIAAKGCEARTCSSAALLSAGQFMLAPTDRAGRNPRPELRPQVVNNSWGGGGGDDWYDQTVAAWAAAGMFPVFSNGNEGPNCGTAGSPGDGPVAYSAGAYDVGNAIARFSSRGPGRDRGTKPNLSAPGVAVRSSVPGDRYATANGTSMAAPHVTGTVALLWSAAPELVGDIDATRAALDATAVDTTDLTCGGTPEHNNVYGQGRLDAYGAALRVAVDSGFHGRVTDAATGAPIAGARVRVLGEDPPLTATTGPDGSYRLHLLPGGYDLEVTRFGYQPQTLPGQAVSEPEPTTVDVALAPLPVGTLTGTVTLDETGLGVPGVDIYAGDTRLASTGGDGTFSVDAPVGSYPVTVQHGMFPAPEPQQVTVEEDGATTVDFVLRCAEECNLDPLWTDRYDGPASSSDVPRAMEFAPDGNTVYLTGESPGDGTNVDFATIAYDPATGVRRWEARYDGPGGGRDAGYGLGLSPDGATVYVTGPSTGVGTETDFGIVAYDAATGQQRWESRYDGPVSGDESSLGLAVSPDGGTIFVTGYSDGENWSDYATVAVDAATGEQRWVARYDGTGHLPDNALSISVAPDGETVHITGWSRSDSGVPNDADYATVAYRASTGEELWVARYTDHVGGSDNGQDVRVSPDSSLVYVTGYSRGPGSIDHATIAYDRMTGEQRWLTRFDGPAGSFDYAFGMELSPDGSALYVTGRSRGVGTGDDFVTTAYDPATGAPRWQARFDGPASGTDIAETVAVSPDGSAVFVTGHSLGIGTNADAATVGYRADTGEELWSARYNGPVNSFDGGNALQVSPDSTRVVMAAHSFGTGTSRDYAVLGYDTGASPELPVYVPWDLRVQPLALDGDQLAVTAQLTNLGTAAGEQEVALLVDGDVADTTPVALAPGESRQVEWTLPRVDPGEHEIGVGHLRAPLRVVGCDRTIGRLRLGAVTVTDGVTCLAAGARVVGPVDVRAGAGLAATGATIAGRLTATDPSVVLLQDSQVVGSVTATGATAGLVLSGNRLTGPVSLHDNVTGGFPIVVAGNRIVGVLSCTGNAPPPVNQATPNQVIGRATGQCADL